MVHISGQVSGSTMGRNGAVQMHTFSPLPLPLLKTNIVSSYLHVMLHIYPRCTCELGALEINVGARDCCLSLLCPGDNAIKTDDSWQDD